MHEDLRTHVERRAYERSEHLPLKVIDSPREAEIGEFMMSPFDENVFWFEITVNYPVLQQLHEPCKQITKHLNRFELGEILLLLEFRTEIAAIAVFLNNVVIVRSFKHIDQVHDVITLQLLHDLNLRKQPIHQILVILNLLLFNHLNRHVLPILRIPSFEHLPKRSLSKHLRQLKRVLIDLFRLQAILISPKKSPFSQRARAEKLSFEIRASFKSLPSKDHFPSFSEIPPLEFTIVLRWLRASGQSNPLPVQL